MCNENKVIYVDTFQLIFKFKVHLRIQTFTATYTDQTVHWAMIKLSLTTIYCFYGHIGNILQVFGFVPQPYVTVEELMKDNDLKVEPRFLAFTPNLTVAIGCEGQNPADRENIADGGIEFYPNMAANSYAGLPAVCAPI